MTESPAVRIARFGSQPRELKHWLSLCEHSICVDRRDKVFALLGLSSDCEGVLVPDYSMSISRVYKSMLQLYLRGTIKDSHDHDLLSISQRLQRMLSVPREPLHLGKTETQSIWVRLHYWDRYHVSIANTGRVKMNFQELPASLKYRPKDRVHKKLEISLFDLYHQYCKSIR